MTQPGTLFLVATPIGNLEDMTLRAIRTLKEVDLIAAEDTRQTLKLLNNFEISKPLTSFYRHNEGIKKDVIVERLLKGENVALVSDAGTPGISDPGEELVARLIQEGIKVVPIPGASAVISGVIVSGLPCSRFAFEGFLPMNKRVRKERLENLKRETRTMVFYEAPHKLLYTLKDIFAVFGERRIAVAREITKIFEEVLRMNLSEAIDYYNKNQARGEFVLILEGSNEELLEDKQEETLTASEIVERYLEQGMGKKEAMKKAAKEKGISKREVYSKMLKEKTGHLDCKDDR
ncbi:MAG: 16S rRNA (cytidine(1402)-2'-O)-methyltransferase [Ignavibacteriales bacterium]